MGFDGDLLGILRESWLESMGQGSKNMWCCCSFERNPLAFYHYRKFMYVNCPFIDTRRISGLTAPASAVAPQSKVLTNRDHHLNTGISWIVCMISWYPRTPRIRVAILDLDRFGLRCHPIFRNTACCDGSLSFQFSHPRHVQPTQELWLSRSDSISGFKP